MLIPEQKNKGGQNMELRIQSVNFDASDQLSAFVEKKVKKLEKFYDGLIQSEVIMKVIKPDTPLNKDVSIRISIPNGELFANKAADTFEEATDHCIEAIEKQIQKTKEKKDR